MARRAWLISATIGFGLAAMGFGLGGCVIQPAPVAVAPAPVVQMCRNPAAVLLRLDNPGRVPAVVGHTIVWPGRTALCVPRHAGRLVAVQVAPLGAGQAPTPVLTPDGRGVLGHPIAIVRRGRGSVTGVIDFRFAVALPMAFAGVVRQAAPSAGPPPGAPMDAPGAPGAPPGAAPPAGQPQGVPPPPPGAVPPPPGRVTVASGQRPETGTDDEADDGTTDSLLEAYQSIEAPVDGNGQPNAAIR